MYELLKIEHQFGYPALRMAGVDEAGRGCLAGPVSAAAIILPQEISFEKDPWLNEIRDSKKLSPQQRETLFPKIKDWVVSYSIQFASVAEIDKMNIFHASYLAMDRAIEAIRPDFVLVDGKFLPKTKICKKEPVIKGDSKCLSIACASILAKVARDRRMKRLSHKYPGYGLEIHKGYPTTRHKLALKKLGVTKIHRKSFGPVKSLL